MRRVCRAWGSRVFAALALASCACGNAPHVVLVSIDTLRPDHLSIYDYERGTTPMLAEFDTEGVIFDEAIAAQTSTAPSHASMLTGLYPPAHGVRQNRSRLADGVPTLGEILGAAGYRTAGFVSGFTLNAAHTGLDRGFDLYDDLEERERRAAATLRRVMVWLEEAAAGSEPLFLFVHFYDPHYSYNAPEPFASQYLKPGTPHRREPVADLERLRAGDREPGELDEYIRRYDGEIAYADYAFAVLRKALRELRLWDDSIVIVVSDHGETLDERSWALDHGGRVTEEQIRIPLAIRLPGGRHGGHRVAAAAHHVDLLPTLLDLLGHPVPEGLHGRSLRPLIEGREPDSPDRALLSYARALPERIPELPDLTRGGAQVALRAPPYKLVAHPAKGGTLYRLFDLEADPGERNDLAAERPDLLASLTAQLKALQAKIGDTGTAPVSELPPEAEAKLRALGYVP